MQDSRVALALRDHAAMAAARSHFESTWAEVARYVFPRSPDANTGAAGGLPRRLEQPELADTTAGAAAMRAAAFLESSLTPRGQRWHSLATVPAKLGETAGARAWLEHARDLLFARREEPGSRFSVEVHEVYLSLACYGTACLSLEDRGPGIGWRYRAVPLAELWAAESADGAVDKVHRRYEVEARQLAQEYPAGLPEKLAKLAEREPHRKVTVLHCVRPRSEVDWGRRDYRGMAWASYHVALEDGHLLRESGYRTRPYLVSRLGKAPGEVYGRGLAMAALPTIRNLNRMKRSITNAANRAVEPPLLAHDDDLPPPRLTPNAINPGWLSADGKPLLVPMQTGARVDIGLEMLEAERKQVGEHFLTTLFDLLVEQPQMTATQVLERASEKGVFLAPLVGSQQDELLGPLIAREMDLLADADALDPPPAELQGKPYTVRYDTPVTRALKAQEGAAVLQTLNALVPLAGLDPAVLEPIDLAKAAVVIADSFGAPAEIRRSDAEMAARARARADREQQDQAAALMGQLPAAARAAGELRAANDNGALEPIARALAGAGAGAA